MNSGAVAVGDGTNPATLAGSTAAGQGYIAGTVSVSPAATITSASDASLTLGGGLTLMGGSLSSFALSTDGVGNTTALVNITAGDFVCPTSGVHTIGLTGTAAVGTYDLFGFTGTAPALSGFALGNTLGGGLSYNLAMAANQLDLIVSNAVSAAWNNNGNGVWSDNTKWNPTQAPLGGADSHTFGNGDGLAMQTTINAPSVAVTVDGSYTIGSLVLNNTLGATYTLATDGIMGHRPVQRSIAVPARAARSPSLLAA